MFLCVYICVNVLSKCTACNTSSFAFYTWCAQVARGISLPETHLRRGGLDGYFSWCGAVHLFTLIYCMVYVCLLICMMVENVQHVVYQVDLPSLKSSLYLCCMHAWFDTLIKSCNLYCMMCRFVCLCCWSLLLYCCACSSLWPICLRWHCCFASQSVEDDVFQRDVLALLPFPAWVPIPRCDEGRNERNWDSNDGIDAQLMLSW